MANFPPALERALGFLLALADPVPNVATVKGPKSLSSRARPTYGVKASAESAEKASSKQALADALRYFFG